MQVLWNKEIEAIKDTGYLKGNISITDALVENFYNEILKPEDAKLMELVFLPNPKQEDLNELLKVWDIEVKGASKSLLLSYFQRRHPNLSFTNYEGPRLKGLFQNIRFKNMKLISHFVKIVRALNENGIVPMILKGGAMRYLRPELPRIMGDIDILVPEKDFMRSAKIAEGLGYWYSKVDIHAIDLHEPGKENGILDIHRFIYMETGKERKMLKGLFNRATEREAFGVKVLVPSHEDLMFITLTNLAKNLRANTSKPGMLYSLFDCKFFIEDKPNFDWNIVRQNAKITNTEVQMNFAMKFINRISKNVFSQEIQNDMPFEKETNDYSRMVMYKRFYLEEIRTKCRAMKIGEVITNPNKWVDYITLKPKYNFLKLFTKHPRLIEMFIKDLNKIYNLD